MVSHMIICWICFYLVLIMFIHLDVGIAAELMNKDEDKYLGVYKIHYV